MAKNCELCGRGPQFGNRVSHAHNVTKRRWNVNLQSVRAAVNGGVEACEGLHVLHPQRQGPKSRLGLSLRAKSSFRRASVPRTPFVFYIADDEQPARRIK